MPYIQWTEEFELGSDVFGENHSYYVSALNLFDEHHKHLIKVMNLVYDSLVLGAGSEETGVVLDELNDYATFHLAAEEFWMRTNAFPGFSRHCEEHKMFTGKIMEIQEAFNSKETDISVEMLEFLNEWLVHHILNSDAEYGRFARELPHVAS